MREAILLPIRRGAFATMEPYNCAQTAPMKETKCETQSTGYMQQLRGVSASFLKTRGLCHRDWGADFAVNSTWAQSHETTNEERFVQ